MVLIMLVMMMTMFMVVLMAVVFATFGCSSQLASQIGRDQHFNAGIHLAGEHHDTVHQEVVETAFAHTASNDHPHALFPQPARIQAGFMRRCRDELGGKHSPALRISVHEREFATAAEMAVHPSVGGRDGDANGVFFGSDGSCHVFDVLIGLKKVLTRRAAR